MTTKSNCSQLLLPSFTSLLSPLPRPSLLSEQNTRCCDNKADPCPPRARPNGRQTHKQVIITQCAHLTWTHVHCMRMCTHMHTYYMYIYMIYRYMYIICMYTYACNAYMSYVHTQKRRRRRYIIEERNGRSFPEGRITERALREEPPFGWLRGLHRCVRIRCSLPHREPGSPAETTGVPSQARSQRASQPQCPGSLALREGSPVLGRLQRTLGEACAERPPAESCPHLPPCNCPSLETDPSGQLSFSMAPADPLPNSCHTDTLNNHT